MDLGASSGGKDALAGLAWHPGGAALATLGGSGRVYCWARVYRENWSAFAPDFTELAENQARACAWICCLIWTGGGWHAQEPQRFAVA
jgi:hypothetical protein